MLAILAAMALQAAPVVAPSAPQPQLSPTVVLQTSAGEIVVTADIAHAPITACNFLRYVRSGAYDGGRFHRTVRRDRPMGNPNLIAVVQAETPAGDNDPGFGPIPLERTGKTFLHHTAGAISMARDGPDTATSSFFIVVDDSLSLDEGGKRNPDGQGFAAFGRVVAGMDVVRRIQGGQVKAGTEQLAPPVRIKAARVLNPGDLRCPAA